VRNCLQIFFVPGLRHAWHWLGLRPVSRKSMNKILSSGGSVALCPGGVQARDQPLFFQDHDMMHSMVHHAPFSNVLNHLLM
jgi:Diacylglycerol acyltransferase